MLAGARNCATDVLEAYFCAISGRSIRAAINGGRLKDAKIVRQSRAANRAYDTGGMGRAVATAPKYFVNWLSLYMDSERFAALVAKNLLGPEVVAEADRLLAVDL